MIREFRDFIIKGNAIDLAAGVLIGAAFGGFVTAFTSGIVNPLINLVGGDSEVSLRVWEFDIGVVINATLNLVITGAVLFFIFVKPMNKLKERRERIDEAQQTADAKLAAAGVEPPSPTAEILLLQEIRDLLKQRPDG